MKSIKAFALVATVSLASFSLIAREAPPKSEAYVPAKQLMTSMIGYQVNKLDRAAKLTEQQKTDITALLVEEANDLGKLQKEHRGDLSFTIPGTVEIVTNTNAAIVRVTNDSQRKAALALVEERKAAFNNRL